MGEGLAVSAAVLALSPVKGERIFPRTAKGGECRDELLQAPEESLTQGSWPPQVRGLCVTPSSPKTLPTGEVPITSLLESGCSKNPCSDWELTISQGLPSVSQRSSF